MAPSEADIKALDEQVAATLTRLNEFATFLKPSTPSPLAERIEDPPNPLHVLRDSAMLVKAHTTKISLLAINKPFTPSAIGKVIRLLTAECLPAMMSAVQICEQEYALWSTMMAKEAQARVRRVFSEMETLLQEVQAVSQGKGNARSRNSLSSTGVVWESCDAVIELEKLGLGGLAVQKAEQYRDTIKDAIEELEEWKNGEDPDTEGHDELLDSDDEAVSGDKDSVEDIFNAANSMPSDRPELKALVEEAEAKLKKVVLLYPALLKRRFKPLNKNNSEAAEERETRTANVKRLDEALESLRKLPHQVDEMVGCFYDLDEERARKGLEKCLKEAMSASTAMKTDWKGVEDEFTAWSVKWREAIG
ncbi:hypothetical protein LTR78_007097 [Recurvomyces mirabilis]|uniref:Cyclin-D1-binding protein 1-like N-terminal domain-containing protein n=1 Tax=Recurvomyces mirabilis TaxID=574656 RepID=A0AAE0WJR8_9PEZI|nr:hypothetical protein LTR78_007097 [Recurvomyces mirabilis]KAK5150932.1 hypothetical protein LTS14_009735 [Recurvomyces mirabilis]